MKRKFFGRASIVVLPLGLWACAAPGPAPLEARHPANPSAAAAPAYRLQVLHEYQHFSTQPPRDAKGGPGEVPDDATRNATEPDHHEH